MNQLSAADHAMLARFEANFTHIESMPQSTDDVTGQLLDAQVIANRLGLYDAADLIRLMNLQSCRDPQTRLDLKQCLALLPQMAQSQDSTTAQILRLTVACDVFGLKAASLKLMQAA